MSKQQKQKPNVITEITLRKTQNLKVTAPALLQEFVKAATKYQQIYEALGQQGGLLAECISKIGTSAGGDLGEGIRKLGEYVKEQECKREEVARSFMLDLLAPLKSSIELEQREAVQFEKNYKRDKENSRQEIVKLEQKTKKAGKKTSPDVLKKQITDLNDKIKEAETLSSNKFREVVLLDRKRYASFLDVWNRVICKDTNNMQDISTKYKAQEPDWDKLVASQSTLPKEYEDMITKQERTFVQIQPDNSTGDYRLSYAPNAYNGGGAGGGGGYDGGSYDSYSSYDSYDTGYSYDYNAGGGAAAGGGGGGASARALYDYASDEATDLQLTAGETITILQEDDGSGWTKGQSSDGRVGIFPTTYIEYI